MYHIHIGDHFEGAKTAGATNMLSADDNDRQNDNYYNSSALTHVSPMEYSILLVFIILYSVGAQILN